MEITIDLEICKLIVSLRQGYSYAVFISKLSGETMRLTIPELIQTLERVAEVRK